METMTIIFFSGFVIALLFSLLMLRDTSNRTYGKKILICIFPISFYCIFSIYAGIIATIPLYYWASYRLSAASALAKGLNIYSNPSSGPIFGWIYGPIAPCLYLPAFLFTTLTEQHIVAGIINFFLLVIPFFCLTIFQQNEKQEKNIDGMAGFLFAFAAMLTNDTTIYFLRYFPADSAAVSFGLLSCYSLIRCRNNLKNKNLFFAALFLNLSVFSKQNEIFILLGQIIYIWTAWKMKTVLRYIGIVAVIGIIFGSISIGKFGLYNLFFNLFIIPGNHPWAIDFSQLGKLLIPFSILLIAVIWLCFTSCRNSFKERKGLSSFVTERPWLLLLFISILMLPMSIIGKMKIGGDVNSYHSIYYLIATVALLLVEKDKNLTDKQTTWKNWKIVLFCIVAIILCPWQQIRYIGLWPYVANNQQEEAYAFAVKHPDEAYFPWHPMVNLMVDNKLYHYSYGVYDREIAGYKINKDLFLENLPSKIKYIVFVKNSGTFFEGRPADVTYRSTIMNYCPEFSKRVYSDNLSHQRWIILSKN